MEVTSHSSDLGCRMPAVGPHWFQCHRKSRALEQLFCLRVRVLAGGLLADLQSAGVVCCNFSNCIFSSRTWEQPDYATQSLGGAIRAQKPAVGPTEARPCPIGRVQTRGLRVLSHTLGCDKCLPDRRAPCHTGAGAMPAAAEQRGPGGSVGARGPSEVEGADRGGKTWERHGPQSPFYRRTPVPIAGPAGRHLCREPVGRSLADFPSVG